MSESSLHLTPHQDSDIEAAAHVIYSEAADEALHSRSLGRDWLALVVLFFVLVTYHIQNPVLQFEAKFGTAFRNESLQNFLAIALPGALLALVWHWREKRPPAYKIVSAVIVALFSLHIIAAVLFNFNIFGAVLDIPQEVFTDRRAFRDIEAGTALFDSLQTAKSISIVVGVVSLLAVVVIWSPWERIPIYRRTLGDYVAALVIAGVVLGLWEGLIILFNIQQFLLPKPSVIFTGFIEIYPRLVSVGWNTFQNAFWGFVVGCGLGILTGLVSARFTSFSKALLPLAIAANSVPIIAFAPIFNTWFGALNMSSKVAIAAVLVYFPAMISTLKGLTSVDNLSIELMKSYAATDWEIFRKVRVPTALPYIFSALKVATTLSMIAAIVSEYFGGSTLGLGYRIREDAQLFRYQDSWAAIIVASLLGILFYLVVSTVERGAMPWHISFRDE
ncbi:MAG: ABC transporter permease [Chloroflexi bacterium]|nr:MAG: ABC transporter permease [Chloroflexota bacterium]